MRKPSLPLVHPSRPIRATWARNGEYHQGKAPLWTLAPVRSDRRRDKNPRAPHLVPEEVDLLEAVLSENRHSAGFLVLLEEWGVDLEALPAEVGRCRS
jgi:hypothetical protein